MTAAVLVSLLLWSTDVPVLAVGRFGWYVVTGLVLPGTLLMRGILADRPRPFALDVVGGTSLAYAVELAVYVPARAAGLPWLVLCWPWVVVLLTLVPRWRARFWGHSDDARATIAQPWWWSWGAAGIVTAAFAWLWAELWRVKGVTGAALRAPYVDDPYHLSLVSGLRRQLPTDLPFVDGEPLHYHWFVHAEVAASSWSTGLEPVLLLQRLSLVPMIAVVILGAALLTQWLTRSAGIGLVAAFALALAGGARIPFNSSVEFLQVLLYLSPTMTFADALQVATATLVILALRDRLGAGAWVAAVLCLAALSGAKGPALPIVVAGLLAVVLMAALLERRLHRRAMALAAAGGVCFLLSQWLLYSGGSHGLALGPLSYLEGRAAAYGDTSGVSPVLLALDLFSQFAFAAGIWVHFRAGHWRDPVAHFLLGCVVAGWAPAVLLESPNLNQLYFKHAAVLFTVVAGTWGLGILVKEHRDRRSISLMLGAALATGLLCFVLVRAFEGRTPSSLVENALPTLVVVAFVAGLTALTWGLQRGRPASRGLVGAVATAAVMGTGLPYATTVFDDPPTTYAWGERTVMGAGGVAVARWLRDHSSTDDVVATNQHCVDVRRRVCDARAFWLSGFSERQVLVEGWAYAERNNARVQDIDESVCCLPFWDPSLLATNDAAFERPTQQDLDLLNDEHGVRWLVADTRLPVDLATLDALATRRHRTGDYVVYDLG